MKILSKKISFTAPVGASLTLEEVLPHVRAISIEGDYEINPLMGRTVIKVGGKIVDASKVTIEMYTEGAYLQDDLVEAFSEQVEA